MKTRGHLHFHLTLLLPAASACLQWRQCELVSRRDGLSRMAKAALGAAFLLPVVDDARAACLPGDLSPECIGVYKIPLQDVLTSPTLNSPEALARNAPDLKYVTPMELPTSSLRAKELLLAQRLAADDIANAVLAGRLQEAGIQVLNLIPKVTGAGLTIQQQLQLSSDSASGVDQIRLVQYRQRFQELIVLWSQIDVEIGQALRGQLGVSAVAQLQILRSLKEATAAFDDFLLLAVDSGKT